MGGVGATPLPSSAGHKGEEDVPWLFLAASHTTQDPLTGLFIGPGTVCSEVKPESSSEGRQNSKVPHCFVFGAVCRGCFASKQGICPTSQGGLRTDLHVGCKGRN